MSTELQITGLPNSSLEVYWGTVQAIPLLSALEEQALAFRYRKENDLKAARHLVLANLRFVAYIAQSYASFNLSQADLIQEGNIGLMKAVKRFDPTMGVRLVSFAVHWIKAEIHDFILRNWKIVKIATTKAQRKLFFNLRKYKKHFGWFTKQEVCTVAQDLGVTPEEVMEMELRLEHHDIDLESSQDLSEPGEEESLQEQYEADLRTALTKLDDRSQTILRKRWLNEPKATLRELAADYNVSPERIRQIENRALLKLKSRLMKVN